MSNNRKGQPTAWKDIVVKWLGLFPVLLVISYTTKFLGIKPLALKLFCETVIVVPLLHYIVTPLMEQWFSDWIHDGKGEASGKEE